MGTLEKTEWNFRKRDYAQEKKQYRDKRIETAEHPLRGTIVMKVSGSNVREKSTATKNDQPKKSATAKTPASDPLSIIASSSDFDGTDPLSLMAKGDEAIPSFGRKREDSIASNQKKFGDVDGYIDETFEPWSNKRANILAKYTTSQKLSISTSFLMGGDSEKMKQEATTTDKVKNRLAQLDDLEEGSMKEMLNLSQTEYVKRIEELNTALITAWKNDQRVKSLKITIQCSKLLGDTSVLQFYPSKFVLITDILDNFGRLVFERIRDKSSTVTSGSKAVRSLPENFTPEEVPESAKETCRNWFYKVASIRELIPRLYVEMAIIKCYSFLTTGEYSQALWRLHNQIKGIADPLVAAYARAYLCRVGIMVAPKVRDHLNPCWNDYLTSYRQLKEPIVQNKLAKQSLDMPTYMQLFPPAIDWLLQCISYKATDVALNDIMEKCKSVNSALILNSVMSAFNPKYISSRAVEFHNLIKESEDSGFPKYLLYKSLGINLALEDPPEKDRLSILNDVWKAVVKLKNTTEYVTCAEVWIDYPLKYFTTAEVNTLLGNIVKNMLPDRAYESFYPQLLSILTKVVFKYSDFNTVVSMSNFLPFIDMFQKESVKVDACKTIMEAYAKNVSELSDTVIINLLISLCKTMHDSVSAISLNDDIRVIGNLISTFLRTVNYGRDFEQQLNFYVEARATFSSLDSVLVMLVQSVNELTMKTKVVVKGNHTRKTAAFVRACMAYNFITIPSMTDIFVRLKLYLLNGQIALANHAIGQADSFFRAAINLLSEVPKTIEIDNKNRSSEQFLTEYINNFLSTLLIVPDHPEHGTMYLVRGLLNALQEYTWDENNDSKTKVYMNAVCLLSAACQETYLYTIQKVDSNDKLYGSGQKFHNEVLMIIDTLVKQILDQLSGMKEKNPRLLAASSMQFFCRICVHGQLNNEYMVKLAANLWKLAQSTGQGDRQLAKRLQKWIEVRSRSSESYGNLSRAIAGN